MLESVVALALIAAAVVGEHSPWVVIRGGRSMGDHRPTRNRCRE